YPPALRTFYQQKLAWTRCDALRCATLTVPMDYAHPQNGKTFTLPVIKSAATGPGRRIGSLVFDPGGPGASGVAGLKRSEVNFGEQAKARFDIVGFDPRGVAGSKPALDCTAPSGTADQAGQDGSDTEAPLKLDPQSDAERQAVLAAADRREPECEARSAE